MTKALRVTDYLGHIVQAIERIDRYTANLDEAAFLSSENCRSCIAKFRPWRLAERRASSR